MYRVELRLNQHDLIDFLDQNPGYKPFVEGIADPDADKPDAAESELAYRPTTRKPRARRKRTVEALQAAAE
jgi:hypothetical protein